MEPLILGLLLACDKQPGIDETDLPTDTDVVVDTDAHVDSDVPYAPIPICVNEWMPANDSALIVDGGTPDWIELHAPGSHDVALDGWTLADGSGRRGSLTGLVVPAGGFLLVYADDTSAPGHLPFELSSAGDSLQLRDPLGDGSDITFGEVVDDFSIARSTDCCAGPECFEFDFRGTPNHSNTWVPDTGDTDLPRVMEEILPLGSAWSYLDGGSAPAPTWMQPGFDDSAWATGAAPLGYGDTWIATTVSYGGDDANKYITTWFRLEFDVADPARWDYLRANLALDDGALVYLNGTLVVSDNLADTADASTFAFASVGDADEYTPTPWSIDPTLLRAGTNTLAVEVHQAAVDSSDITFDLGLDGEVAQ